MSSRFSGTAPTHKPVPWCKKSPVPPIILIGGTPRIVQASLRFYSFPPSGAPRDLSFYLANILLSPTGHGVGAATAGGFTASLSVWYNSTLRRLITSADLFDIGGPVCALQTTILNCPNGRPLMADLLHFAAGIPAGQDGRLLLWE